MGPMGRQQVRRIRSFRAGEKKAAAEPSTAGEPMAGTETSEAQG